MARPQPAKGPRIGVLHVGNADAALFMSELRSGLRELGYIEGQNIQFEPRSAAGKLSELRDSADELVRLQVDVIVAFYTSCALAAKEATRKIPIVVMAGDPVETGLIDSLPRPGGNVTGLSLMAVPLHVKGLEMLREMRPTLRRVAVLGNTADPAFAKMLFDAALQEGPRVGIDIHPVMTSIAEAETAFSTIVKGGADGIVVQGSLSGAKIADLAVKHQLPASSFVRSFVEVGGLVSYGPHGPTTYRRSAVFVHKILQGGNPATISVEQPTKFELALNLKTAKAIGIEISEQFLSRADAIIE